MRMRVAALLLIAGLVVSGASAQNLISARAGFVNYTHGKVNLPPGADLKPAKQLEDGQALSTASGGRAELILTPGSYLRLDTDSEVRMVSTQLTAPVVELLRGTECLEVNDIPKTPTAPITVVWQGHQIPVAKTGIYRFEPNSDSIRIYVLSGKLRLPGEKSDLKSGRYQDLSASGVLSASGKFSAWLNDFDRFNSRRAQALTSASELASYTIRSGYYGSGFLTSTAFWGQNGLGLWMFDPYSNFYTYVPYRYSVLNPWGYYYYAPRAYTPPRDVLNTGGGTTAVTRRPGDANSTARVSAPPRTVSPGTPRTAAGGAPPPRVVPPSALPPERRPSSSPGFASRPQFDSGSGRAVSSGDSGSSSVGAPSSTGSTRTSSPAPAAAPASPARAPESGAAAAPGSSPRVIK